MIEKIVFKFVLKKGVFLTKFHFYIKRSMVISGKGLLQFHQETSSLIGNRTNMFLPFQSNSCYESDYECICIVTNGKTGTVPLNHLSSVVLTVILKKWEVETSSKLYSACICSIVKLYNKCKVESDAITGFIQSSMSKIQELFKDFSRIFYSFQGLKT